MEDIKIKENKMKLLELIILGIIMVSAGIFVLVIGIIKSYIVHIIVGLIGTMFFGTMLIYMIKRSFNSTPLLLIEEAGITDMSTAMSVGFIGWEEIESIKIQRVLTNKYVGIKIKDINKVIDRVSLSKRINIKCCLMVNSCPISILLQSADIKEGEVMKLLENRLEKYREKQG